MNDAKLVSLKTMD